MNKMYLINSRPWFLELKRNQLAITIDTVSEVYWKNIKEKGYDSVWLLGVWDNEPKLTNGKKVSLQYIDEYKKVLPDITENDIIDSCFAINDYRFNAMFGTEENFFALKTQLNKIGLKLILDFIPNHFHFQSDLIGENLEAFVFGKSSEMNGHDFGVVRYGETDNYIANGRDPYTGSWSDTAQINWFSSKARELMKTKLEYVSRFCDGVRCDMAMVITPDNFRKTWDYWLKSINRTPVITTEWWKEIIPHIKTYNEEFVFIAECYWNLQLYMLDCGFDYVYDKDFYDGIITHNINLLQTALQTKSHLPHSVMFLDNHDEQRSASLLANEELYSAIVTHATLPGLKLYYEGQEEGSKIRLPMQVGRSPFEEKNEQIYSWYQLVFSIVKDPVFVLGDFEVIVPLPVDPNAVTSTNLIAYKRSYNGRTFLIVVNYSKKLSQGHIPYIPQVNDHLSTIVFFDRLTSKEYAYERDLLMTHHLFVELRPWQSHIFEIIETF